MNRIDDSNYELWLLRYAEGDLTATEREAVEQWLVSHPEAAEELSLYNEAPRLEADAAVEYADAKQLIHSEKPLWVAALRWAAAAAVVVGIVVPTVKMLAPGSEPSAPMVASTEVPAVQPEVNSQQPAEPRPLSAPPARQPRLRVGEEAPDAMATEAVDEPAPIEAIADEVEEMLPTSIEPEPEPLVAVSEQHAAEHPTVVEVNNMIVYDSSSDWSDLLIAANNVVHSRLQSYPGGRYVSNLLPDNGTIDQHVVRPVQNAISQRRLRLPQWVSTGSKIIATISNTTKR